MISPQTCNFISNLLSYSGHLDVFNKLISRGKKFQKQLVLHITEDLHGIRWPSFWEMKLILFFNSRTKAGAVTSI